MFSNYTTKIQISLARLFENWAKIIFKKVNDKKQQEMIELISEPISDTDSNAGSAETKFVDAETSRDELQRHDNADQPLPFDADGIQLNSEPLNPAAINEPVLTMQDDGNQASPKPQKQAAPEVVGLTNARENLQNNSAGQTEAQVSSSLDSETGFGSLDNSQICDPDQSQGPEPLSSLNPAVDNSSDPTSQFIPNSTAHPIEQRELNRQNGENDDVLAASVSLELAPQENFVGQTELKSASINNHVPGTTKPAMFKSPGLSVFEDLLDGRHQMPSAGIKESMLTIKAGATKAQQNEQSNASSSDSRQLPNGAYDPITITTVSRSSAQPAPLTAASRWPELPGEGGQTSASSIELGAHRWPQLPADVTASGLTGLSTGSIRSSKTLAKEMERIRYLEREQKGLLWNG